MVGGTLKIRHQLAAIASALTLIGAVGLAGAGAASATTEYLWCWSGTLWCIVSNGSGNAVGLNPPAYSTNFASEYGEMINGHEYVEYYQIGTNACLTDSGANVYLQTCSPGETRQLWRYHKSVILNDYATVHYGHNDCMTVNGGSGDPVIVEACTTNDSNQKWDQSSS
jgi:hypothetical protein